MLSPKHLLSCLILSFSLLPGAYAWNSLGHRLIAQIAYDNMTPEAIQICNKYNRAVDRNAHSLMSVASWLDMQRRPDQKWMQPMHYIDIPFSWDDTPVKPPNAVNAVTALEHGREVMLNKQSSLYDKGFNLRVLLHVVGDIHQPMHATDLYSKRFPNGDKGGNLYYLKSNPVGDNLHAYWDRGGGLLMSKKRYSARMVQHRARQIETRWPCKADDALFQPQQWANESHQLALSVAYQIAYRGQPSRLWQQRVRQVSEERIARAGCRLAALLNNMCFQ